MALFVRKQNSLETPNLLLRKWKQRDREDFLSFVTDPLVMLPAGSKPVETPEEEEREFRRALRNNNRYAIVLRSTGRAVGNIQFQKDHRRHQVNSLSIGYELHRDFWGKGYMTEALKAMVRCGFDQRELDVLSIGHFTVNDRSARVIQKCGFHCEGVLRQAFRRFDGIVFDDVCYCLLREEYQANRAFYCQGS